jgi:hypothetical protein
MRRITVTASTIGQSNPSQVSEGKPYRYRGDPSWTPGDARYRQNIPAHQLAGGEARAERREKRITEFVAALAELGVTDPWHADNSPFIAAGRKVGVGEKTALSYRTALRQRQPEEATDA